MPELIEAEIYRGALAATIGRRIAGVEILTPSFFHSGDLGDDTAVSKLIGSRIEAVERHGKVVIMRTDTGHDLSVRFGMTGRVIVDGDAPIDALEYGPRRDDEAWDRLRLHLDDGFAVRFNDPRRFGSVSLDADLHALGPDIVSATVAQWRAALVGRRPIKAVLLDQARLAGLGNLLCDEILWRSALAPTRPADSLDREAFVELRRTARATIRLLSRRGGSHRGDLQEQRHVGGRCPADGTELRREVVAGRTTYWCPTHQH